MKYFKYAFYALLLVLGTEILNASTLITISSKKYAPDETRNVSSFHSITSSGSFDVFITMGSKEGLRLEGDSEDLKEIETIVENGVLKIRIKSRNSNWMRSNSIGRVNVYVSAKAIKSLSVTGSGDMTVQGTVKAKDLSTAVTGSGSLKTAVDAENYSATVTGSGEMDIKGRAQNAKITVTGSGDFEGREFKASVASAKVSGSGSIDLTADTALNATTSGSGSIRYAGNATVKSSKTGSGSIQKF